MTAIDEHTIVIGDDEETRTRKTADRRVAAIVDEANMRMACCAMGRYAWERANDGSTGSTTLALIDVQDDGRRLAALAAETVATMIACATFMDHVHCVLDAVRRAEERGRMHGRLSTQHELRQAMGLA